MHPCSAKLDGFFDNSGIMQTIQQMIEYNGDNGITFKKIYQFEFFHGVLAVIFLWILRLILSVQNSEITVAASSIKAKSVISR